MQHTPARTSSRADGRRGLCTADAGGRRLHARASARPASQALAAISPNTTITKAKNLSTVAQLSMAGAGELIAKAPACLALPPEALRAGLAGDLLDLAAAYEFYTRQWLAAAVREQHGPQREASFAGLHRG